MAGSGGNARWLLEELIRRYGEGQRCFPGANLAGADLSGADLARAQMARAKLVRTNQHGLTTPDGRRKGWFQDLTRFAEPGTG